jgi:hypothetical protein
MAMRKNQKNGYWEKKGNLDIAENKKWRTEQ